jgi:hypothetical protein
MVLRGSPPLKGGGDLSRKGAYFFYGNITLFCYNICHKGAANKYGKGRKIDAEATHYLNLWMPDLGAPA